MKKSKKKQNIPVKQTYNDSLAENIKIFIACLLSYLLLFWLFPVYSFIALYLVVGLIIVSVNGKNNANLYIGGVVGLLGSVFASIFLTVEKYIYYVNTMPMSANPDIPASLYTNTLFNLVKLSPLSYINPLLYIFISTVLCAAFTQLGLIKEIKKLAGGICVAVLVVNFLFVSLYSTRDLARYTSVEPPNLSYAYDAIVLMKTVYLMKDKGYYKAHVEAQYNDSRRNADGTWTKEGAQPGTSRLMIRHPFIFYLWKYISLGNASRVIYFSILFCAALLPLSYLAARKLVSEYAMAAPVLIMPFLFAGTAWLNIFFPDWWAGLFLFSALLFWILKRFWVSALFLLFSLLSREVIFASYLIFILIAFLKHRHALKPLLITGIVFAGLYFLHFYQVGEIILEGGKSSGIFSFLSLYSDFRLIPTSSYMMFLYGFFKFPIIMIFFISLLGSIVLRNIEFIFFTAYVVLVHNTFATGSYWGNHFMLIMIFAIVLYFKIVKIDFKKPIGKKLDK